MKSLLAITISLSLMSGAGVLPASESVTAYPENDLFTRTVQFSSLTDFAMSGENCAFADGRNILIYSDGNLTSHTADKTVARLEYGGENLYYADETGGVFNLDNTPSAFEMPEVKTDFKTGEYFRYDLLGSSIKFTNLQNDSVTTLEGTFYKLKQYDGRLFAIKDNAVVAISGTETQEYSSGLQYFYDFAAVNGINSGDTKEKLKQHSLKFVTLQAGAYRTEIDLTALDGSKFTLKGATEKLDGNVSALLLCYTGNAAVVAVGDKAYVTLNSPSSLTETEIDCYADAEFSSATVTGNRIYSSPYVIVGTSALFPANGTVVKVLHKLEPKGVLGSVFYEVEYKIDEESKIGYVSDGFLTEYIFDDKPPVEHPDPMYSEENEIKTVILILLVVILTLAAISYLIFMGVPRKKKQNKDEK